MEALPLLRDDRVQGQAIVDFRYHRMLEYRRMLCSSAVTQTLSIGSGATSNDQ